MIICGCSRLPPDVHTVCETWFELHSTMLTAPKFFTHSCCCHCCSAVWVEWHISDSLNVGLQVDVLTMTVGTQRRAVLEAVAYGTFLRDVETHVDTEYHLITPVGPKELGA